MVDAMNFHLQCFLIFLLWMKIQVNSMIFFFFWGLKLIIIIILVNSIVRCDLPSFVQLGIG